MRTWSFSFGSRSKPSPTTQALLASHFGSIRGDSLVTARRTSPVTLRVDLQLALESQFTDHNVKLLGGAAE